MPQNTKFLRQEKKGEIITLKIGCPILMKTPVKSIGTTLKPEKLRGHSFQNVLMINCYTNSMIIFNTLLFKLSIFLQTKKKSFF